MTRSRAQRWSRPVAVLALASLAVGGWWLWPRVCAVAPASPPRADLSVNAPASPPPSRAPAEEPAYSPLADELHAGRFDAAHDVAVLRDLIGQFTTTLRLSERPPLGDNADIAAALAGKNRRQAVFVPSGHPALRDGLLVDRFGTPYHFHARSADAIDVRSAGADRVLFTADDVVSRPGGN